MPVIIMMDTYGGIRKGRYLRGGGRTLNRKLKEDLVDVWR